MGHVVNPKLFRLKYVLFWNNYLICKKKFHAYLNLKNLRLIDFVSVYFKNYDRQAYFGFWLMNFKIIYLNFCVNLFIFLKHDGRSVFKLKKYLSRLKKFVKSRCSFLLGDENDYKRLEEETFLDEKYKGNLNNKKDILNKKPEENKFKQKEEPKLWSPLDDKDFIDDGSKVDVFDVTEEEEKSYKSVEEKNFLQNLPALLMDKRRFFRSSIFYKKFRFKLIDVNILPMQYESEGWEAYYRKFNFYFTDNAQISYLAKASLYKSINLRKKWWFRCERDIYYDVPYAVGDDEGYKETYEEEEEEKNKEEMELPTNMFLNFNEENTISFKANLKISLNKFNFFNNTNLKNFTLFKKSSNLGNSNDILFTNIFFKATPPYFQRKLISKHWPKIRKKRRFFYKVLKPKTSYSVSSCLLIKNKFYESRLKYFNNIMSKSLFTFYFKTNNFYKKLRELKSLYFRKWALFVKFYKSPLSFFRFNKVIKFYNFFKFRARYKFNKNKRLRKNFDYADYEPEEDENLSYTSSINSNKFVLLDKLFKFYLKFFKIKKKLLKLLNIYYRYNVFINVRFFIFSRSISGLIVSSDMISEYLILRLIQRYRLVEILPPLFKFLKKLFRKKFIQGYAILFMGRFTRKDRAVYRWEKKGPYTRSNKLVYIDYISSRVALKYSTCSFKISLIRSIGFKNII